MHPGLVAAGASIIASSAAMLQVLVHVARFAKSPDPVAIVGDTGSGKSTIARLLHEVSGRPGRLADISAGELDTALAPDDLFGHGRGAFTGAVERRRGLFVEAAGGTVLLDDFHWLRRSNQLRLLRVLDRREFRHLGDDRAVPLEARIIVGTHRSLDELMRRGTLVPDLRWRLGLLEIRVPSLAERVEDIAPLALRFLSECLDESGGRGPRQVSPHAIAALELCAWPGNVRQLRAVVRRAFAEAGDVEAVDAAHLGLEAPRRFDSAAPLEWKRRLVRWALWRTKGRVREAADLIGAHRNTVSAIKARLDEAAGRGECIARSNALR